mgnify:CR=1 FL=1
MIKLANPNYLWLFLIYIPLVIWYIKRHRNNNPTLLVSSTMPFAKIGNSWKLYLKHFMFVVKLAAIGCLILILCRPQTHDSWSTTETEGTDIVLALDVSTSMLARDFNPDRFNAAKDVAMQFVSGRPTDNIGVVIFAGESFTQVPLTLDKTVLMNYLQDIKIGVLEDGTAIGDGIATAINRIKNGKAKSKSIILLTDGSNNTGVVAPLTAAEIAKEYGIKIYTIGVGSNGTALFPVGVNYYGKMEYQKLPVVIDEATLRQIADSTGGKYFRATNEDVLNDIFKEIDQLEKTRMDVMSFSHTEDNYMPWAILLLVLVLADQVVRYTLLRNIP